MRKLATLTAIVSLAAFGCAQESAEPTAPPTAAQVQPERDLTRAPANAERVLVAGPPQAAEGGTCPVSGRTFQVMTNDIDDGIALEIASDTLPPEEIEAIAGHLRDVSRKVITEMGAGPIRGTAAEHAMRRMPDAEVEVERTGQRVWMTIVAENSDDTPRVRELGRDAADAIRRGDCPLHGRG